MSNGIILVCIWLYLKIDGPIFWENASQTHFWGCKGLWCIFLTFLDIFEKFRPREIFWHQLDQDRMRIDGIMLVWKKAWKKVTYLGEAVVVPSLLIFLQKFLKKFFCLKTISDLILETLGVCTLTQNGLGTGVVFHPFWPPVPRGVGTGAHGVGVLKYPRGPTKSPPKAIGQAYINSFIAKKEIPY